MTSRPSYEELERRIAALEKEAGKHQRTEAALSEAQQIIDGILNAIPVRVFWKDKNLVFLGCNRVFARDAGFEDSKDIIGKDDFQMPWSDQAELYRGDDLRIIENRESRFLIEEPQTTPDGKTITLLTSKIPLQDVDGEIVGVLGTYMDITERKLVEEALEEEHKRLKLALEDIKTLRGIVPICSHCKKIRDDKGYWNQVEKYVTEHSEAQFSHGICPDCVEEHFPD